MSIAYPYSIGSGETRPLPRSGPSLWLTITDTYPSASQPRFDGFIYDNNYARSSFNDWRELNLNAGGIFTFGYYSCVANGINTPPANTSNTATFTYRGSNVDLNVTWQIHDGHGALIGSGSLTLTPASPSQSMTVNCGTTGFGDYSIATYKIY